MESDGNSEVGKCVIKYLNRGLGIEGFYLTLGSRLILMLIMTLKIASQTFGKSTHLYFNGGKHKENNDFLKRHLCCCNKVDKSLLSCPN